MSKQKSEWQEVSPDGRPEFPPVLAEAAEQHGASRFECVVAIFRAGEAAVISTTYRCSCENCTFAATTMLVSQAMKMCADNGVDFADVLQEAVEDLQNRLGPRN